jgi:multidrug resistance efflux pump
MSGMTNQKSVSAPPPEPSVVAPATRLGFVPVLVTLIAVLLAGLLSWAMWEAYAAAPWTRDGTVLAYVVSVAPEVSGRIVNLAVADNQFVKKGDLLLAIDPADYAAAVAQAEANLEQAKLNAANAQREAARRAQLTSLSTSQEEQQTYATTAATTAAAVRAATAALATARINLERTEIRAPVNGYVTNLLTQQGDYANVGTNLITVVNADSFWVAGYFEETNLQDIHDGDPATVKLMGYRGLILGHVDSIARGIGVANVQPDRAGLANVNPIFTWVRLAQRVPVRIHIDSVPPGVRLVVGETASIEIERRR